MTQSMTAWSRLALGAYYFATLPQRKRRNTEREGTGCAPVMILFYHRIADHPLNGWTMTRREFARQIDWLQHHFDLVSLADAQQRIACGANYRPAVSLTFDDGYADNCAYALPLLLQRKIPFTYFVTSQNALTSTPFPHDVAAGAPLAVNSIEQLKSLAAAGVEIGAHTRTHCDLGAVRELDRLRAEVIGCREELAAAVGCPIRYFAFPYGLHQNLNVSAFALAREAGYLGVCSAYGGYNFPGDDAFHLQRIHADPELIRLKNWLLVDPRKEARVVRYSYDTSTATDRTGKNSSE